MSRGYSVSADAPATCRAVPYAWPPRVTARSATASLWLARLTANASCPKIQTNSKTRAPGRRRVHLSLSWRGQPSRAWQRVCVFGHDGKNASAVLTGRCDVVSDWAVCSVITTAPPHRSSGAPAGRNGWSGGEVCSGAPIAEPVPRWLVSANLKNASRIRSFGSVRIFGHDETGG